MNTEQSRKIVDSFFEKLGTGASPEEISTIFSTNIDWDVPGATDIVPWVGKRKNQSDIASFYRTLGEKTDPIHFEIYETLINNDAAVITGYFEAKVKSTQKIIASEFSMHLRMANGKIDRYRFFENSYAVAAALN